MSLKEDLIKDGWEKNNGFYRKYEELKGVNSDILICQCTLASSEVNEGGLVLKLELIEKKDILKYHKCSLDGRDVETIELKGTTDIDQLREVVSKAVHG